MAKKKSEKKPASAKANRRMTGRAPRRRCGAMSMHHHLLEMDSGFRRRQVILEQRTARMMDLSMDELMPAEPRRIPVVVHVIANSESDDISDRQIESQMAVLNRDFRLRNPDRSRIPAPFKCLAVDSMIEFELATLDPAGNETSGITRTRSSRRSFAADDSMKTARGGGIAPWPTDRYLNIWVCTLTGGLLGYAQFPGGPSATDGVVILNTAFGTTGTAREPFDMGRTTTHEIGHFFNLRHIWGDREDCRGDDFVDDTPGAMMPNYGKPAFPSISCGNGPSGDMFMNYMDYVDDDSMHMFSMGQVARMHATLTMARSGLGI
jgi:Pregnancy-associated plasma protein-A